MLPQHDSGMQGWLTRCDQTSNALKWFYTHTQCNKESDVYRDESWTLAKTEAMNLKQANRLTDLAPEFLGLSIKFDKQTNRFYPVVEMEWIVGKPLYFTKMSNVKLGRIIAMVDKELAALGISHGDLSDLNIMWNRGKIRLVDWCNALFY